MTPPGTLPIVDTWRCAHVPTGWRSLIPQLLSAGLRMLAVVASFGGALLAAFGALHLIALMLEASGLRVFEAMDERGMAGTAPAALATFGVVGVGAMLLAAAAMVLSFAKLSPSRWVARSVVVGCAGGVLLGVALLWPEFRWS